MLPLLVQGPSVKKLVAHSVCVSTECNTQDEKLYSDLLGSLAILQTEPSPFRDEEVRVLLVRLKIWVFAFPIWNAIRWSLEAILERVYPGHRHCHSGKSNLYSLRSYSAIAMPSARKLLQGI